MSISENIKLDEENIAALSAHSVDRQLATMADNVVWTDVGIPEPMKDKAAIRQYLQGWFTAFPDLKISVKNRVVTDDQIASEIEFTGTHTGPLQLGPGA